MLEICLESLDVERFSRALAYLDLSLTQKRNERRLEDVVKIKFELPCNVEIFDSEVASFF